MLKTIQITRNKLIRKIVNISGTKFMKNQKRDSTYKVII